MVIEAVGYKEVLGSVGGCILHVFYISWAWLGMISGSCLRRRRSCLNPDLIQISSFTFHFSRD
jgi:hypothetical protein